MAPKTNTLLPSLMRLAGKWLDSKSNSFESCQHGISLEICGFKNLEPCIDVFVYPIGLGNI
jgi:hypothetical protein